MTEQEMLDKLNEMQTNYNNKIQEMEENLKKEKTKNDSLFALLMSNGFKQPLKDEEEEQPKLKFEDLKL